MHHISQPRGAELVLTNFAQF